MEKCTLEAHIRNSDAKPGRLRREGCVPAVMYGTHTPATILEVPVKALDGLLSSGTATRGLIELQIIPGGEKKTVVIKEIQKHPIKGNVLHVDFHHISLEEKIRTHVPILLVGEEDIARKGGIVQHQLRSIEVECLPMDIPDTVTGDISGLDLGQQLRVEDLPIPEGARVLDEPDEVVVSILAPRRLEEEEEKEEGVEGAEDQVPEEEETGEPA